MLKNSLKRLASRLPETVQDDLKRFQFRRQINRGTFVPIDEPEIKFISSFVKSGDSVIDVGANVGHYTLHLSNLVGDEGRVYSLEPIPVTFALLASNTRKTNNVTLLNVAASSKSGAVFMEAPRFESGLTNFYRASIGSSGNYQVRSIPLDDIVVAPITLIKIDAEGHDLEVLRGAERLIRAHKPTLIIEVDENQELNAWLREKNYKIRRFEGSPNVVAQYQPT